MLIIDEQGFYRVCSAIFEAEGYSAELFASVNNLPLKLINKGFGLIVISYPFGAFLLDEIEKLNIGRAVSVSKIHTAFGDPRHLPDKVS